MSPEQIRGEKLDGRSDFFSLGVVFYELLTGSRPFPGDTITTLVYQILHTEPRDPLQLRGDLPGSARDVFARLLAKSPGKRPAGAKEFLREVSTIERELAPEGESATAAAPTGGRSRPRRNPRKRRRPNRLPKHGAPPDQLSLTSSARRHCSWPSRS
jgi:serine/threonine protein kinase